ncbi:2,4'-dihydroxyacetophenone dioxygenase family protein [Microbacterium sp. F2]|uniref:2,4'-dihydroxyacetophenone dioxygenase family protein n=1 Tax=Microbacterium sp. F2 TaxID=3422228 RepID=UPI003FCFA9DF
MSEEMGTTMAYASSGSSPEPDRDDAAAAYRGEQPFGMVDDLVVEGALRIDDDDRFWVPQSRDVRFKPLVLSVSQGYFVNILRVRRRGILSRHRHAGPVQAVVLRGRWHYLEHDWWAEEGSFVFEPPGDIHTLEIPDGVDEMATLFHVTGAYVYVDPDGTPTGVEDVFTKIANARAHYERVGLGPDYVERFIR